MATLSLAFLGPFTVVYCGQVVTDFRTRSVQALLAYLAIERMNSHRHRREALAELLWPGYPAGSARKNLRQALYELGRLIPEVNTEAGLPVPLTQGTRETLQINPDCRFELDTSSFTQLVLDGTEEALLRAVELYRGDFLVDFVLPDSGEFENWASTWRGHYRRQVLEVLDRLIVTALQKQDFGCAEFYARQQLAIDDLRETAVGHLMQALIGQGQRSAALLIYSETRQRLQEELGVAPAAELSELWRQIQAGEIGARAVGPSLYTTPMFQPADKKPAHNLPIPTTPFIGRSTEIEQVKSLVLHPAHRLITLTGPGGIGKTRLSIQSASEVVEAFSDGVFFASLAPVHNTEGIVPALAKVLDFSYYREIESPHQQVLDYLRGKQLLFILDNFEHLIGSGARGLVGEMLSAAPGVKLLVTSRAQLNIQGEQLYPLGGMYTPEVGEASTWDKPEEQAKPFCAIQLFLERARRVRPDFALTKENVTSVIKICQLVHGMPLGLELAAAWVELLPPDEIAAEITRSLDFLESDQVNIPDRQRSMRAVFESSWNLLSDGEREAFLKLCVFVGSFSRDAAQQVSGASLRTLLGLANKSFLQPTNEGRYQLHELMRQYGEEQLKADADGWQEAHDRHAEYFVGFIAEQSLRMQGPEQLTGFSALETEFATNIKAAWDWLVSERRWNDLIGNMLLGLFQFGWASWKTDGLIHWLRVARLSLPSELTPEERLALAIFGTLEVFCEQDGFIRDADTLERLGLIWQMADQYGLAEKMGFWHLLLANLVRNRNLAIDVSEPLEADFTQLRNQHSKWQLGMSFLYQANHLSYHVYDGASLLEAARIFDELGVFYEQGVVAELLGRYAYQQRRPPSEVSGFYSRARQFYLKLKGYLPHTRSFLLMLVDLYFREGNYEQGFATFEEEKRELERMGQMRRAEYYEHWESLFAARYSTYEHALSLRQHNIEMIRKLGSQSDLAWRWFELGEVHRIFGEPELALNLFDQAYPIFEKMNITLGLGFDQRARGDLAVESKRYSEALAHYQKFYAFATEDNQIWTMAQARGKIALANAYLGNIELAREEMHIALGQAYEYREDDLALQVLLAEAVCLLQVGKIEDAIELASFLQNHPGSWNETKQHARGILENASRDLNQKVVQAALERGKALDLDSVLAELTKL